VPRLRLDQDAQEAIDNAFDALPLFLRRMREYDGHEERMETLTRLDEFRGKILRGELTEVPSDLLDKKALGSSVASWPLFRLHRGLQQLCSWAQHPSGSELNRVIAEFDLESQA